MTTGSAELADERRREVLEVAARVLSEDGPHGLTLRRVATEAGGSTQLIYTLFGGKAGLADALFAEGFARLGVALRDALVGMPPAPDPRRLLALGMAYRGFALRDTAFFSVMFGRAVPGFTPGQAAIISAAQSLDVLRTVVEEYHQADVVGGRDVLDVTFKCLGVVHGLASLEVAGILAVADPEAFTRTTLELAIRSLQLPDEPLT